MGRKWNLKEIVVGCMLGAVLGVVLMIWDNLYIPLSPILGPIGIEVLYGMYFTSAMLAMYIIRKPGAAILGSMAAALTEVLLGSPFGLVNLVLAGFVQAVACELVFMAFKYKKFNMVTLSMSGILIAIFMFVRDYIAFGYGVQPTAVLIGMISVRMLSGVLLGALITKLIGDTLKKTGVVNNFNIGRGENC